MQNNTPWHLEQFHDDTAQPHVPKAKRAGGRRRLAIELAAHFKRHGLTSLSKKLRSCEPGSRCGSGACPMCTAATGRCLSEQIRTAFPDPFRQLMVTIIPSEQSLLRSDIAKLDMDVHRARLADGLADAGLARLPVIGGFDISHNIFSGDVRQRIWIGHWCLFFYECDKGALQKSLSFAFPKSLLVPKPIIVASVTRTPHIAHWYAFPNSFDEKRTEISGNHRETATKSITKYQKQYNALMRSLDRVGLISRTFQQWL